MNTNLKIRNLWEYLGVQDNESLIVVVYNADTDIDQYLVTTKQGNELIRNTINQFTEIDTSKPFHLIQQRGDNGKHQIPSVEQMERDKLLDYDF